MEPLFRTKRTSPAGDGPRIPGFLGFAVIGSGGFSKVYTAHQEQFGRTVAVKVITAELGPDATRRFEREQQAAGLLDGHPNVIRIYGSGTTTDGQPYLVMEHHAQGSLADRLRRHGPLPVADVLEIGVLLAGALATAHRQGVVHRDVKPQNVLLSRFSGPVLADFGIAALDPGRFTTTTEAFSANHAAPEVLGGRPATAAADLYSLASTLHELLAGRPPFADPERPDLLALIHRVRHDPVPSIGRPDLAPEAEAVLTGLLARDPGDRPASAAALAQRLRALQAELGLPVTPDPSGAPDPIVDPDGPAPAPDATPDLDLWRAPSPGTATTGPAPATPATPAPATPAPATPAPASAPVGDHDHDRTIVPSSPRAPAEPPADPPGDGTVHRSPPPAGPPRIPGPPDPARRPRWPWAAGAGVLVALLLAAGFALLGDDDGAPRSAATTSTTLAVARLGPCPADAADQLDFEQSDPTLTYDGTEPATGVRAAVDAADDTRATITWTDANAGRALYLVLVRCSVDGDEPALVPIGKALPGQPAKVVVTGLQAFNYCFAVGTFPTAGGADRLVLGQTEDGAEEACLDE